MLFTIFFPVNLLKHSAMPNIRMYIIYYLDSSAMVIEKERKTQLHNL